MKSQILTIARKEFSDRFRSGWVVGCILVWFAAVCLTSFFGLIQIGKIGFQGYERTVISLLSVTQYLVPLLALLIGHDIVVGEREDRTLGYLVANGVSRESALVGKAAGAALALAFSLVLGFGVAGAAVGIGARDSKYASFLTLALSGVVLGLVFLAISVAISSLARSRVQSLVVALLVWGMAVFAFDLVALGLIVSFVSPAAQQEIDIACDPMHVNAVASDVHSAFDSIPDAQEAVVRKRSASKMSWLWINPIDLFRSVNLERHLNVRVPVFTIVFSSAGWLAISFAAGIWRLRRLDL